MNESRDKRALVSRREFAIGGLMAAVSAFAWVRQPHPYVAPLSRKVFEDAFPQAIGQWRLSDPGSVVLPPPDALRDRLYDNLLTRVYVNPTGKALMLVVAYKNVQDGIVQVHRPEICYPASGFTLESESRVALRLGGRQVPAKAFVARKQDRVEQVLYFTRLGHYFPLSWRDQRMAVLDENLIGRIPDGLLARVSLIENERQIALPMLANFLESLSAAGGNTLQAILTGSH